MVLDYDDTLCPSSWISAAPERVHAATDAEAHLRQSLPSSSVTEGFSKLPMTKTEQDGSWLLFGHSDI